MMISMKEHKLAVRSLASLSEEKGLRPGQAEKRENKASMKMRMEGVDSDGEPLLPSKSARKKNRRERLAREERVAEQEAGPDLTDVMGAINKLADNMGGLEDRIRDIELSSKSKYIAQNIDLANLLAIRSGERLGAGSSFLRSLGGDDEDSEEEVDRADRFPGRSKNRSPKWRSKTLSKTTPSRGEKRGGGRKGRRRRFESETEYSSTSESEDSDTEECWEAWTEVPFRGPTLTVKREESDMMLRRALENYPSASAYIESLSFKQNRNKEESQMLGRMIDCYIKDLGIQKTRKLGMTDIAIRRIAALSIGEKKGDWVMATQLEERETGLLSAKQRRRLHSHTKLAKQFDDDKPAAKDG